MSNILKGLQLNELSPATLASYKKKAGAEATAADKQGDTKKADKRFSGIVKATKKEFDNDSKDVKEAYNNYHANRTGFSRGQRDDERHDLDKPTQVWGLKINGKVWSKGGVDVTFTSKQAALNTRNAILKNKPDLEIGLVTKGGVAEELDENLHKWFKEKWVRFGPDGKIRGDCARGDDSEGKPKCLPQSKAHSLGKKGRASAAARKRREDPNPERSGKAINVNTKKKSNESVVIGRDEGNFAGDTPVNLGGVVVKNLGIGDIVSYLGQKAKILAMSKTGNTSRIHIPSGMGGITKDVLTKDLKRTSLSEEELDEACWKGYHKEGNKKMFGKTYPNCVKNTNEDLYQIDESVLNEIDPGLITNLVAVFPTISKIIVNNALTKAASEKQETAQMIDVLKKKTSGEQVTPEESELMKAQFKDLIGYGLTAVGTALTGGALAGLAGVYKKEILELIKSKGPDVLISLLKSKGNMDVVKILSSKFLGKHALPFYAAPKESIEEGHHSESCPHCGGEMVSEELMNEKKDACYYKVKSRYKVWPSAYASGALVKCRKKGADSWGNGGKKNEGVAEGKIKLSTDPNWYGAEVGDYKASGPIVNIPTNRLVGFEPDDKMNQPASKANVEKIVDGLKQGAKLPPLMVRQYKNGYQVLDGHHRFWAYKLLGVKSISAQVVPAEDIEEITKQGVAEDQLDEKWTKKYKDSINCSNPKGFSQKAHCAGKQKNESSIMSGLNQLDEGWKEKLGAAALAGSMALGAGAAHSRVTPDGQGGFTGGLKPTATVTAPSDNKPSAEAPKGFSKEYLQSVIDGKHPRPMISVEKAQELLKSMP